MRITSGSASHACARQCPQAAIVPRIPAPRTAPSLRTVAPPSVQHQYVASRSSFVVRAAAADNGNGLLEPSVAARTVPSQQVLDIWRNADAVCFDVSAYSSAGPRVQRTRATRMAADQTLAPLSEMPSVGASTLTRRPPGGLPHFVPAG